MHLALVQNPIELKLVQICGTSEAPNRLPGKLGCGWRVQLANDDALFFEL